MRWVSELDVVDEVTGEVTGEPAGEVTGVSLALPAALPHILPDTLPADAPRVLLIDTGYKHSIARCLQDCGLRVLVAPPTVTLATLQRLRPDGVLLANGPGDPQRLPQLIALTRTLVWEQQLPFLGICLGHQVLGLAAGARTSRLPFGHHGANHAVRDLRSGRVTLTAQNHGFQVEAASLPAASGLMVSHVNLADGSVEGLAHPHLPVCSVQFHPEAAPGPHDNRPLFAAFAELIATHRAASTAVEEQSAGLVLVG